MNRTIKDATLKVFHYPDIESVKANVLAFVKTYNFAKRLKALRWKKPFEAIKCRASRTRLVRVRTMRLPVSDVERPV